MDIQKEREAFEKLPEIKKRLDMKCVHFNGTWYATNPHMGNSFATASYLNGAWKAWRAAKAQAVPEGFVLMPKEPTDEIIEAMSEFDYRNDYSDMDGAYRTIVETLEKAQEDAEREQKG